MGTWGPGLYQNDTTCDVRDMYRGLLQDQLSNHDAYEKTMAFFKDCLGDEDDEPLLWFALAETQWKTGRLLPEVKDKALEWIEKGALLALWEESQVGATGWIETLKNLKATLESPVPKEKKIRKPSVLNQNLWNVNDVYAYQFHKDASKKYGFFGKYVLLQKNGEGLYKSAGGEDEATLMRVHVFDKAFSNPPTLEDIEGLRLLPIGPPDSEGFLSASSLIELWEKNDYPSKHLTFLGNIAAPPNKVTTMKHYTPFAWKIIEGPICNHLNLWRGKDYETVEDGVFRCAHPADGNEFVQKDG